MTINVDGDLLTDDDEARLLLGGGAAALGVDLALVDALVGVRHRPDGQVPLGRARLVDDAEAVVAHVHELAHRQEARVAVSHPRDLKKEFS